MSAVCPVCGVAVVPGYVKCPKCHAPLPAFARTRSRGTIDPGGTALEEKKPFPYGFALIAVLGAVSIIAVFGMRHGKKAGDAVPVIQPAPTTAPAVTPAPVAPQTQVNFDVPPTSTGPTPQVVAADLMHQLGRQRLWGTVEVIGLRADIRSGGCSDPAMKPLIDRSVAPLKGAGLTKLRCLEQSGRVVFERDL